MAAGGAAVSEPRPDLAFPRSWLYLIAAKLVLLSAVVIAVAVHSSYR